MMGPADRRGESQRFSFRAKKQEDGSFRVELVTNPKVVGVGPDLSTAMQAASKAAHDFSMQGALTQEGQQ
jgi:predicted RNase H-like HicB family nuclease